ncbi:hypothetical protein GWI33_021948 [Rhynchophorus ferrugineus]|uniref:Uncharacterized protein n=1 Tax=Rhynchophorus ferrugineus TaxID=354439 RepID=A0A834IP37_RHYFE|nr:hypothetical protein GWI33_021948 [Rhynchophorus ferrugineus]
MLFYIEENKTFSYTIVNSTDSGLRGNKTNFSIETNSNIFLYTFATDHRVIICPIVRLSGRRLALKICHRSGRHNSPEMTNGSLKENQRNGNSFIKMTMRPNFDIARRTGQYLPLSRYSNAEKSALSGSTHPRNVSRLYEDGRCSPIQKKN